MEAQQPTENAGGRRRRSISFRSSLLRSLVMLILLLSLSILAVSTHASRRAVRTLCQELVTNSVDSLENDLNRFFEPISSHLSSASGWASQGLMGRIDPARMNSLFTPIIEEYSQISSLNTGDADGAGYMLLRQGEHWVNRLVDRKKDGKTARWSRWQKLGDTGEQWTEQLDYDPRERPWYRLAMDQDDEAGDDRVFWTDPYIFFTTREPGITASKRVRDQDGVLRVLAFDILLHDLSKLTSSVDRSPRGFTLVTDLEGRLVGLPRHSRIEGAAAQKAAFMKRPAEIGIPLIVEASAHLRSHFGLVDGERFSLERGLSQDNVPFRWRHDGMAWWTAIRPCMIENGPSLWIAVTVPEEDFLAELQQGRVFHLLLAAAALAVATLISFYLARRYNRPIQRLIQQSDRLTALNTEKIDADRSEIHEIAQLHDAQERMRLALDSFARYVPSDVVRELLDKGEAAVIGGRHTPMSILFTDIIGFTAIAESMGPTELTRHMATYFDAMIGIIKEHGGTVDKLIGDAIVAFWGAPKPDPRHADNAVRAALACTACLAELNRAWEAEGLPPLPTRFGISTGDVVVGNVGSQARLSYTALGDSVNLASRLEGANSFYGSSILVSSSTVEQVDVDVLWRRVDKVAVKGRSKPELIFEPLGFEGEVAEEEIAWARGYERAFDAYLDRRFGDAIEILNDLTVRPGDLSAERLGSECRTLLENPPPDDWNGVSRFASKG